MLGEARTILLCPLSPAASRGDPAFSPLVKHDKSNVGLNNYRCSNISVNNTYIYISIPICIYMDLLLIITCIYIYIYIEIYIYIYIRILLLYPSPFHASIQFDNTIQFDDPAQCRERHERFFSALSAPL